MDRNKADQLRSFIILAETAYDDSAPAKGDHVSVAEPTSDVRLRRDLHDLADRLRSIMESSGGDYALGYEMGLQRAAEMIENLLRRNEEGNGPEIL